MGDQRPLPCPHTVIRKQPADGFDALPFQIEGVNQADGIRILIRHELPVNGVVAEDAVVAQVVLAPLEPLTVSPADVLGDGPALVLRNGRQEGKHHGAGWACCIQVLLLESDVHAVAVEQLHVVLAIDDVPSLSVRVREKCTFQADFPHFPKMYICFSFRRVMFIFVGVYTNSNS